MSWGGNRWRWVVFLQDTQQGRKQTICFSYLTSVKLEQMLQYGMQPKTKGLFSHTSVQRSWNPSQKKQEVLSAGFLCLLSLPADADSWTDRLSGNMKRVFVCVSDGSSSSTWSVTSPLTHLPPSLQRPWKPWAAAGQLSSAGRPLSSDYFRRLLGMIINASDCQRVLLRIIKKTRKTPGGLLRKGNVLPFIALSFLQHCRIELFPPACTDVQIFHGGW